MSKSTYYNRAKKLSNELNINLKKKYIEKGSTKDYWIDEVRRLEELKNQKQKRGVIFRDELVQKADHMRFRRYSANTKTLSNGAVRIEYIHNIPERLQLRLNEDNLDDIERQISAIVDIHRNELQGKRALITLEDSNTGYGINTPYLLNIDTVIRRLMIETLGPKAREYEDDDVFNITTIKIVSLVPNQELMGHSTRTIIQANNKWHIVNPVSRINCLYQALYVCSNFHKDSIILKKSEEAHKKRVSGAKQLKKIVKPSRDNFADNKSIQEVCDYLRKPINLYNNVFQLIKTFNPKKPFKRIKNGVKHFDIQRVQNHCLALVDKKLISKFHPNFEFDEIVELKEDDNNNDTIIKKKTFFHIYNEKIMAWDIETSTDKNGLHVPYACSVAWFEYKCGEPDIESIPKEQQFWGLNCLQDMSKYLYENLDKFKGYTLYAHNGGKYDLPLAIRKAFIDSKNFIIEGRGCVELNNAWIGFTLRDRNDRKRKIYFRDSFRLLPMSLKKLCKELKVKHQKLDETISHEDINLVNYNQYPQLKKYLTHDVLGLLECIQRFGMDVYEELGIDITKCFTGASLSKANFFKSYYNPSKYPVYTLSDKHDQFIRDSYFGGRVECFSLKEIEKLYYYDFTSLYPDVGRKYLPYGQPEDVEINSTELPDNFFGWVRCKVRTKDFKATPKHAIINDSRLIFPVFKNWTEMNLFSEELDFNIYEYQFIDGIKFKKARFLNRFFTDGFRNKALAKKEGKPAMAQAHKIIINSGYGFWGLKTKNRDGIIIDEPGSNEFIRLLNTDKLLSVMERGDYLFMRVKKDLDVKDFNVSVAAAISSYARSKLHKLITSIKNVGGEVHYCDTDSIITNININDYPKIKKEFQWDGDGSELGSLKNECDEYVEKIVKNEYNNDKELLDHLRKREKGNFSFDKGVISGCKQYALKKDIEINGKIHRIEICKCKGYSQSKDKLVYDDILNICDGKKIKQIQSQFRCPKSNYVSETSKFCIKTQKIEKSFSKCYTKGLLFKGITLPIIV